MSDIIGLCQALSKAYGNREICIAAFGNLTVPATFAAFLDDSIRYLYVAEGLVSFRSVIESEEYKTPLSNFIPGILQQTDIPDVVAQLAPKRVMLSGTVDARGATVPVDQLRLAYGAALAGGHVAVKERSEWSPQAVAEFVSGKSASNRGLRSRRIIFG